MAVRLKIGDYTFFAADFSVSEDATPLSGDDTTGSVGTITFTIIDADPYLTHGDGSMGLLLKHGYNILLDKEVRLESDTWGFTLGTVSNASRTTQGTISVTAISRLGILNAYNVHAQPFVGTLGNLFRYYCGLVGIASGDVTVHSSLNARPVVAPGWVGELWYNLKQLAVAQNTEIALVGDKITLRPVRSFDAAKGFDIQRDRDTPIPTLAQAVEVYRYDTYAITNALVYPPGGWTNETEVLNVNAGETAEYQLPLSASVSSIQQPVMQTSVSPAYIASSVYTIVANDGLPVTPEMWAARGGSLSVSINPDTSSLTVRIRGALNVPTTEGVAATNFSVGLGSDATGNRYSTLRIVGTGVAWEKTKKRIRTGVLPSQTGTDIGVTIDNPYLQTLDQVYRAGTRAARAYSGSQPSLNARVISVSATGGQAFGNVNGARVYDDKAKRWYRVRTASTSEDAISIQADDDLTHDDVESHYVGLTYDQVRARIAPLTYREDGLSGLKG